MKIKMNIKPVDIQISDNWIYGLVASLVDRDDFLQDLEKARKELGVKHQLSYEEVNEYFKKDKFSQRTDGLRIWSQSEEKEFRVSFITRAEDLAEGLRKKYLKSSFYSQIIFRAILQHKVSEVDLNRTTRSLIPGRYSPFSVEIKEPEAAIIISPETKLDEVKDEYNSIFEFYAKKEKRAAIEGHFNAYGLVDFRNQTKSKKGNRKILLDTVSNIQRDRKWYWMHKNGLSYQKIWEQTPKSDRPATRDGIIKAIKQFKKRLSVEL